MNIMFMTKFPDGTETNFRSKILKGITGNAGEFKPNELPKLHTMRESFRVKCGMNLCLANWSGVPYRSTIDRFVKDIPCTGTQEVMIRWVNNDRSLAIPKHDKYPIRNVDVCIDGVFRSYGEIKQLAINDGFDDVEHFFKHFKKSATYNLIHWTNLRY